MTFDFTTLNTGGGVHPFVRDRGVADPNIISFSVAEMRLELAPCVKEAMGRAVERGCFGYAPPDREGFHAALRAWMARRHNWSVQPEWAVPCHGVIPAIGAAIRVLTEPGDPVIIQTPVYQHFYGEVLDNGRQVLENPLKRRDGKYTMDFDDLREKAKQAKLLVLCSPHNPVGRVWTREELETLGRICLEEEVWVVSDEIHFDLDFTGRHLVLTEAVPALRDRTIVCTAPSKTFNLAGCSLANIFVENEDLRKRLSREITLGGGMYVNTFGYAAAQGAYEGGEDWLDALLEHLTANRKLLEERMTEILPGTVFHPLEGTYLQWIDLNHTGMPPEELEKKLEAARVFVSAGKGFGDAGEGFIRFNLACPARSIREAMDRLAAVL